MKNFEKSWGLNVVPPLKSTVELEPGSARELPARGVHERREQLDRWADLNALVAAKFRRTFVELAK